MKLGDLTVHRLGFGAMRVIDNGSIWGEPSDRAKALKVLRRAAELGVNFFDTAESYGPHTSEILIAEALHPYPKGFVIGTKCGIARPSASRWDADGRPEKNPQLATGGIQAHCARQIVGTDDVVNDELLRRRPENAGDAMNHQQDTRMPNFYRAGEKEIRPGRRHEHIHDLRDLNQSATIMPIGQTAEID